MVICYLSYLLNMFSVFVLLQVTLSIHLFCPTTVQSSIWHTKQTDKTQGKQVILKWTVCFST